MLAMVVIMAVIMLVIVTILVMACSDRLRSVVVIMVVMMSVIVTMVVVIMTTVAVIVPWSWGMRLMMVSPTLRLERAFDLDHLGAKPSEHVGDDVILADAQPFRPDLGFEMPVAKMPGQPHLVQCIAALHLKQRLCFRHDLDQTAILELIGIAMGERGRFGEDPPALPAHPPW